MSAIMRSMKVEPGAAVMRAPTKILSLPRHDEVLVSTKLRPRTRPYGRRYGGDRFRSLRKALPSSFGFHNRAIRRPGSSVLPGSPQTRQEKVDRLSYPVSAHGRGRVGKLSESLLHGANIVPLRGRVTTRSNEEVSIPLSLEYRPTRPEHRSARVLGSAWLDDFGL